jgi:hypothetical protein
MIVKMLFLSGAVMLCNIAFCQNAGKLVLGKGQKYSLENKFSATIGQEMMGQSMDSKAEFLTSSNIEVKDVKDDNYELTNTYTKITANISAMGQDMSFDSDKKEDMDGEMGSGMKDLIGQPKEVVVDKNGKIIMDKKDTAIKEPEGGIMSMMMKRVMGSPEETGYGLSEAFMIIPAKASTGFSWGDSTSADGVKKSVTYTLKEIKGTDAIVTISGTLDVDTKTEMQGTELSSKSTGKINGEETVDLKTGLIRQRNTTIQSSGKLIAMGQEIPVTTTIIGTSTIKSM